MKFLYLEKKELSHRVHLSLKIRLIFYFVLSFAITGISIFHIVSDDADIFFPTIGFAVGLFVGTIASRILTITWDKGAKKVISRMDIVGATMLIVYTVFELYRSEIVAYFVSEHDIVSVSFALLAGIMYGRLLGIKGKIGEIFEKQKI